MFLQKWSTHHTENQRDLYGVDIYIFDSVKYSEQKQDGKPNLKGLKERWMVDFGSLEVLDPF